MAATYDERHIPWYVSGDCAGEWWLASAASVCAAVDALEAVGYLGSEPLSCDTSSSSSCESEHSREHHADSNLDDALYRYVVGAERVADYLPGAAPHVVSGATHQVYQINTRTGRVRYMVPAYVAARPSLCDEEQRHVRAYMDEVGMAPDACASVLRAVGADAP